MRVGTAANATLVSALVAVTGRLFRKGAAKGQRRSALGSGAGEEGRRRGDEEEEEEEGSKRLLCEGNVLGIAEGPFWDLSPGDYRNEEGEGGCSHTQP